MPYFFEIFFSETYRQVWVVSQRKPIPIVFWMGLDVFFCKIGFVTQNLFFFSGTLRENLILLNNNINDEKIYETLKKVNLYNKFYETDKKLDYFINFNGSNLSLGEKQRLAIIRCILNMY